MPKIDRRKIVADFTSHQEELEQSIAKKFGKKLQELRKEHNLTQKQMAELLIVAESTYANWEQGRREPSLMYLLAISRTFRISMDELFDFFPTGDELKRKYES